MFQNPTVNLNALCSSCAKIACCSSQLIFTFAYAASNIHNASSNSSAVSTFVLLTPLFIQPNKQKPNGFRSGDSNSSFSVTIHNYTHVHMTFFLRIMDSSTSQNIDLSPESLCIVSNVQLPATNNLVRIREEAVVD